MSFRDRAMLEPGARLAQYEIHHRLGEGCGGGEVYAATDTELGRAVALKILPPTMTERRRLLETEAKTLAALDHPNIVRVYGVEEWQGVPFIVRELVEGCTLGELIAAEPVSLEGFFQIAIPLADAVGTAHAHGITHRDLAPDNVMVDAAGRVKVLDFSMAGSSGDAGADPGSMSTARRGMVEGALYVSPEQTEGKPSDARSDVFSLGILCYELATGRFPFAASRRAESLIALRERDPAPVAEVNPGLPPGLGRIVHKCLEKAPARRYADAGALHRALQSLRRELSTGAAPVSATRAPGSFASYVRRAIAFAVVAALAYGLGRLGSETASSVDIIGGTYVQLTSDLELELYPSLSPEGDLVVFASNRGGEGGVDGDWDIYLQRVDGERALNLTELSPADDSQPAFSPDGRRIAFRSERDGGGVFVMGATGEAVRRIAEFGFYPSWSPDGAFVAVTTQNVPDPRLRSGRSQLWTVNVETGESRRVLEGDAVQPHWSPGGHRIAFWSLVGGHRDIRTVAVSRGPGAAAGEAVAVPVTADAALDWSPAWSSDGKHLYFSSNRSGPMNLWRVPIDELTGQPLGAPEPASGETTAQAQHLRFSANGARLAYASVVTTQNLWRFGFNPDSATVVSEPVAVTKGTRSFYHPQVSPDGEWVVVSVDNEDLFVVPSDGKGLRRLTDDDHRNREPRFSPDGERIAFQSDRGGSYDIWIIDRDGSGLAQLTDTPELTLIAPVWSPDGDRMACWNPRQDNVLVFDPRLAWSEQTPEAIESPDDSKRFFPWSWSKDGKWLAGDWLHSDGTFQGVTLYGFETGEFVTLTDFGSGPTFLERQSPAVVRGSRRRAVPDRSCVGPNRARARGTLYRSRAGVGR